LLTAILALSPSVYAQPTYTEPPVTIGQGQSETLTYQFCGGGIGGNTTSDYVMNVTAANQGKYVSPDFSLDGVTGVNDCVTGQFMITVPANALPGNDPVDVIVYCWVYPPGVPPTGTDNAVGSCENDQAEYDWAVTITGTTPLNAVSVSFTCTPNVFVAGVGSADCAAQLLNATNPTGTFDFTTNSTGGSFDPPECSPGPIMICSTTYTDSVAGTALLTAEYSGDSQNAAASNSTAVTVAAQPTPPPASCPALWLTEGLAPAASTTGDDNVYVTVHWDGQTPVSVDLGAFPSSASMDVNFVFNPVTMQGPTTTVLMNVMTEHTPDGTYTIDVAAQLTDPQSGKPCSANMKALVTVGATSVFVGTSGQNSATAIWLTGLPSPFMVSGNITASQYSNFVAHMGANNELSNLTFTVTGPTGTNGQGTLTIPKSVVNSNFVPALFIDGEEVRITVTQDSTNFYVTYTTHFSTHSVVLAFVQPGSITTGGTTTAIGTTTTSPTTTSSTITIGSTVAIRGTTTGNGSSTQQGEPDIRTILISGVIVWAIIIAGIYLAVRSIGKRRARRRAQETAREAPGPASPAPSSPATAPVETDLFCTSCGKPRKPGAKFCSGCGADLREA
jgi:hypothetical protein